MAIALIGASGNVGAHILKELSNRGHTVTAIARRPENIAKLPHVTARKGDIHDKNMLTSLLKGHGIVISSIRLSDSDPRLLLKSIKAAGTRRYLAVGGTGSLDVAPGIALFKATSLPEPCKTEAVKGSELLSLLQQDNDLNWTFISPSAQPLPGLRIRRPGASRYTYLPHTSRNRISLKDVALALVNEIESPAHHRKHLTVGY